MAGIVSSHGELRFVKYDVFSSVVSARCNRCVRGECSLGAVCSEATSGVWSALGRVTIRVTFFRNPCDRPPKTICTTAVVKTNKLVNSSLPTNYRGPGAGLFWDYIFCLSLSTIIISRLCKLTLSDQAQISPRLCNLVLIFLAVPPFFFLGGGRKAVFFFSGTRTLYRLPWNTSLCQQNPNFRNSYSG